MNKMPKKKSHTVRRLLSYVGRGYLIRFFLVLVCILVSAVASVAGSIFLGALIDISRLCWPWNTRCSPACSTLCS